MKIKIVVLMVALLGMMELFAINAHAEYGWHTCTVEKAGFGGDLIYIFLRDVSSGTEYTCIAPEDREKEMLAIVLTAIANNMEVRVLFDDNESHPELYCLYLQP
jgi:hypothetical protein